MSDAPDGNDHKDLLKAAEGHIVTQQQEIDALQADLENMIEAQALETEQMVQMSEQLWKLEEALMSTTSEKEAALMIIRGLKDNVERIRVYAEDVLTTVKEKKTSRVTMAAQVFEIKSMVDTLNLAKKD